MRVLDMYTSNMMYSIRRIEYIVHFKKKFLSREVHANVRNIILKHMFITISFVFIATSSKRVTIYCIASEH